jgi:ribosomal protein S18 acetylase RimI-like enzyme
MVNKALRVDRAGLEQLDEAADLFHGYLQFYKKEAAPETVRHFIAERLHKQDSVFYIAWSGDIALGFVQLYPSFASLSLAPSWILNDLYVAPSARTHGAGAALMRAAQELGVSSGAAEIFLQTARDNTIAQHLYELLGYQRDDEFLVYTLSLPRA